MAFPVILFIPVSSAEGIGEYTRSVILAEVLQQQIPDANIHFIINKHIEYVEPCPFHVHYSDHSATKDTPKVKKVLEQIRPDLVIFDCAGRSQQLIHAKSLGAKVIFISQHKKKRARGLKIRRLLNSDLHWVVQPDYAIAQLSYLERLKLKLLGKQPPKNIGPILSKINHTQTNEILEKYQLVSNNFFLFNAGSGGHKHDGNLAADVFYEASVNFHKKTNIKTVMVFGGNYPKKLPIKSSVLCIKHVTNGEFLVLLNEAKGRVISAGDTMLQSIELKKPSVAVSVSKDQPARLQACLDENLVILAKLCTKNILEQSLKLLNDKKQQSIIKDIESTQSNSGMDIAISDIKKLLNIGESNQKIKRYLFFVSQNYSFPVLRPLQDQIRIRGDQVKWFLYGDEINTDLIEVHETQLLSIENVIKFNPHAVFVPGNVVPSFIPGLKVQVFHGLPSTKAKKGGQLYHYIIRGMFDLYCTQGPDSTKKFEELKKKHQFFHVVETGWCKLDPLFKIENRKNKTRKKAIFLASTFSPRFSKAEILYPVILEMMKKFDFDWYVTLHPKMNPTTVNLYKSIDLPNVQFIESTELIENFVKSDLMLCDTSSIIYEFLTQLKPVITFQTEKDEPHLINVENISELEEIILSVINKPDTNQKSIAQSVSSFHPYTDGQSSKRVLKAVDEMLSGNNLPKKKKPLNIIRNYKLRKELDYWR